VLALVMAASLLAYCLALSQVPQSAGAYLTGLATSPLVFLVIVNVILLVVGCFMEALAAMLILIPILVPAAMKLGIDPIQFGAVVVLNLMIGLMHPPIGLLLFVVFSVGKIRIGPVMLEILPFLAWSLIVLGLAIAYPPLTTWLPAQMR